MMKILYHFKTLLSNDQILFAPPSPMPWGTRTYDLKNFQSFF